MLIMTYMKRKGIEKEIEIPVINFKAPLSNYLLQVALRTAPLKRSLLCKLK